MMTLVVLCLLVYFGAWLAARFAGYDAAIMPFLLGILLEQITSSAERAQEAEQQHEALPDKSASTD